MGELGPAFTKQMSPQSWAFSRDLQDKSQNSRFSSGVGRCLLLLTFRSLAAIVSEKFTVFPFSDKKAKVTTNYDGLESLMLYTKFRENRLAGSGEDF